MCGRSRGGSHGSRGRCDHLVVVRPVLRSGRAVRSRYPEVRDPGPSIRSLEEQGDDLARARTPQHGLRLLCRGDRLAVDLRDAVAVEVAHRGGAGREDRGDDGAARTVVAELAGERGRQLRDLEAQLLGRPAAARVAARSVRRDRRFGQTDPETVRLAVADDADLDRVARPVLRDQALELADAFDLLPVDPDDDVATL